MAQRLDVARPTARRALQELANKGLLTRRRGVGTRVTPPHVHRPMKLSSLNEDLALAGFTPTTKVLGYGVREATAGEAAELDIATGEGVLDVKRLRYADDHPLAILTNLIPLDIAPSWQDLGANGLYHCLRELASTSRPPASRWRAWGHQAEILDERRSLLDARRPPRRAASSGSAHVYRPISFRFSLFTS